MPCLLTARHFQSYNKVDAAEKEEDGSAYPSRTQQDELVRTVQYRTGMLAGRDSLATRQYIEESASDVKQPTKRQVGDWLKGEKGFQRQKTSGVALPKGGVGSGGLHNFALVIAKSLPTSSYVFMHHTNDW